MARPPRLLIVHHTVSPATEAMLEAVRSGTRAEGIAGVEIVVRAALSATAADVLAAGAVVLGTPANLGYISGALKHFFDTVYYTVREETRGLPYAAYLHATEGPEGALRALASITTGLGWVRARPDVVVSGMPTPTDLEACWELAATLALGVVGDTPAGDPGAAG